MSHEKKEEKKEGPSALVVVLFIVGILAVSAIPVGYEVWKARAHPPQDLADYDFEKHHEMPLSTKGMPGKFERFDVVANAAFAQSMAKMWDGSAQLVRIKVSEAKRGALIDVSDDEHSNYVRYEFVAPGSDSREHASVSHGTETGSGGSSSSYTGLEIEFRRGAIHASHGSESPIDAPPPTFGCSSDALGGAVAASNMQKYSLNLRPRQVRNTQTYYWRWEASGDGPTFYVCDATCSPGDCPH